MELTEQQYQRIAGLLPVQRGNVTIENRTLLNALIIPVRKQLHMAGATGTFREWAHRLCTAGPATGAGTGVCGADGGRANRYGGILPYFNGGHRIALFNNFSY